MKRLSLFTLATRDLTVGHWRFRGDLGDDSGHGNTLTPINLVQSDWQVGLSEPGVTTLTLDGSSKLATLPAASADDFDFGTDGFTVEVIMRVGNVQATQYIVQKFSIGNFTGLIVYIENGQLFVALFSAGSFIYRQSSFFFGDNRWHYVAVAVDRGASVVRFYMDGVPDPNNPQSTSTVPGSISAPTADLLVGENVAGDIDELCISHEVLTDAAIADRAVTRWEDYLAVDPRLFIDHLPAINQDNDELTALLAPMNELYHELVERGDDARKLISWHDCPEQFLPALASSLGFELLDAPFATEAERRKLLRWATWIYMRKGTPAAIKKIIELLGFNSQLTTVYASSIPLVVNTGRTWLFDFVRTKLVDEQFNAVSSMWDQPLSGGSIWEITGGAMRGSGNGQASSRNARLFTNTLRQYKLTVPFSVVDLGVAANPQFGVYLRYQNDTNWVRVRIDGVQGISYRRILFETRIANVLTETTLAELTGIIDPYTGTHVLTIWADHDTNRYTIGIDDRTVCYQRLINGGSVTSAKKGLWVDQDATVAFHAFQLDAVDQAEVTRVFDPDWQPTTLQIGIADNSHPAYEEAKEEFLKEIIPRYVPLGVEVAWVFWDGGPPQ